MARMGDCSSDSCVGNLRHKPLKVVPDDFVGSDDFSASVLGENMNGQAVDHGVKGSRLHLDDTIIFNGYTITLLLN